MAVFDRVLVVANPVSGSRRAGHALDEVVDAFRGAGCKVDRLLTERPNHGRDAAGEYGHDGALIVAFGGDGTFNEILNGADLERSVLTVIPAGTGNVLAKEIGVARSPLLAARQLLGGRVVRLEVSSPSCITCRTSCAGRWRPARGRSRSRWTVGPSAARPRRSPWGMRTATAGPSR